LPKKEKGNQEQMICASNRRIPVTRVDATSRSGNMLGKAGLHGITMAAWSRLKQRYKEGEWSQ